MVSNAKHFCEAVDNSFHGSALKAKPQQCFVEQPQADLKAHCMQLNRQHTGFGETAASQHNSKHTMMYRKLFKAYNDV